MTRDYTTGKISKVLTIHRIVVDISVQSDVVLIRAVLGLVLQNPLHHSGVLDVKLTPRDQNRVVANFG